MALNEKELNEVSGGYGPWQQYAKGTYVNYGHGRRRRRPLRHRDPLRCHRAADLPVEQHQEPRPDLHQPEADHLSHHPSLSDRQHQSPAKRRGIFYVVMLPGRHCVRAKRSWVPLIRILRALTGEGSEFYTKNSKRGGTDFVGALAYPSAQRQKAKVGRLESGPRKALCARQEKLSAPH